MIKLYFKLVSIHDQNTLKRGCVRSVKYEEAGAQDAQPPRLTLLAFVMHSLSLAMALAILCTPAAITRENVLEASTLASLPSLLSLRLTCNSRWTEQM